MKRRRRWIIAFAIVLLFTFVGVWKWSEPPPTPAFIASLGKDFQLISERGYYTSMPDMVMGYRVYAVHAPAEELLPSFEKLGRLRSAFFQGGGTIRSRQIDGLPIQISGKSSDGLTEYHLVPARPLEDRRYESEGAKSEGWSTVWVQWKRPLTHTEKVARAIKVPWLEWRYGKEKDVLYIKDRSSQIVDVWNKSHRDFGDRLAEDPAGPGITD